MDASTPRNLAKANLRQLAKELRALRDLLGTLSLQLSDIQFETDMVARANAAEQTKQLLKACQLPVT